MGRVSLLPSIAPTEAPAASGGPEPVLARWKVSDVLRRYPQLLEVLIDASPAFHHLRNPLIRKVQTRLVTVAQAAGVAGLSPAELTRTLNQAIGATAGEAEDEPPPACERELPIEAFEDAPVGRELDVRPYQARGEEPFSAIVGAARDVPPGQVLRLRNTFEPVPLYDVLGKRGFAHHARQLGADDWEILFLRTGRPADNGAQAPENQADEPRPIAEPWPRPDEVVQIDVSDLVPPEPMVRILEAATQLQPGQTLLVEHVRRPVYLYPRLEELGYEHQTRELAPGRIEILIRRPKAPHG